MLRGVLFSLVLALAGCGGESGSVPVLQTFLLEAPAAPFHADMTATFLFEGTGPVAHFVGSVDGADFQTIQTPFEVAGLAPGQHSFEVCAVDASGTRDPTPATHTWNVEPDVDAVLVRTPPELTTSTSALFEFVSPHPDTVFEARIDGGNWTHVLSPLRLEGLEPGQHLLELRAAVPSGRMDETWATHQWIVRAIIDTAVDGAPAAFTREDTFELAFSSNVPGATFEARVDDGLFETVPSIVTLDGLGEGAHSFEVRALSPSGDADPTPTRIEWVCDLTQPDVAVTFPPPVSVVDAPTMNVCGTASDNAQVASVTVNGVAASSKDSFSTWQAEIPVKPGENKVDIVCTDAAGNVVEEASAATIRYSGTFLVNPISIDIDERGRRAYLVDRSRNAVIAVDLDTGQRSIVTDPNVGGGARIDRPARVAYDAVHDRLVLQNDWGGLSLVDLPDGRRTEFTPTGEALGHLSPRGLALHPNGTTLFASDHSAAGSSVRSIDLETGQCTVIFNSKRDSDSILETAAGLGWDAVHGRLLIVDPGKGMLVSMHPTTGAVKEVSGFDVGRGPSCKRPLLVTGLDAGAGAVFVLDGATNRTMEIDVATGDRTVVPLAGERIGNPEAIIWDGSEGRLLVTDIELDKVFEVDGDTGVARSLSGDTAGSGVVMDSVVFFGAAYSPARQKTYVTGMRTVHSIDRADGHRQLVSSRQRGSGTLDRTGPIEIDTRRDRALVIDTRRRALVAIDLDTGDRVDIADDAANKGNDQQGWIDFGIDEKRDKAVILTYERRLLAVDLKTGQLETLVDRVSTGMSYAERIAVDSARGCALILDRGNKKIVEVDLATGAESIFGRFSVIDARDIEVDPAGKRVLVVANNGLEQIPLATRVAQRIDGPGSFPRWADLLALDPDHGCVQIMCRGTGDSMGALFTIELETGARTMSSRR